MLVKDLPDGAIVWDRTGRTIIGVKGMSLPGFVYEATVEKIEGNQWDYGIIDTPGGNNETEIDKVEDTDSTK